MKKKILLLFLIVGVFTLTSCGKKYEDVNKKSNYSIIKVYYSDHFAYDAGDEYKSIFVIVDYDTKGKKYERISDKNKVMLKIGNNNYNIVENKEKTSSRGSKQTYQEYSYFERISGYHYLNGNGTILGKSDPIRFFAHFTVNPNDLATSNEAELVINGDSIKYSYDSLEVVNTLDDLLRCEEDFNKAHRLASFIWRIDYTFEEANFLREVYGSYGSDFNLVSKQLTQSFNENVNWGISISELSTYSPSNNVSSSKEEFGSALDKNMPNFNLEIVLMEYPESAELIKAYVNDVKKFAKAITTKSTTDKIATDLLNQLNEDYEKLCESLGIKPLEYY